MLFGRFKDTVFTKRGSELEKQLRVLDELKAQYPDNEELNKEYEAVSQELKGEKEIENELANTDIGMYVLHDIILQIDNNRAKIDYVVITPAYVYLVECKSLVGDIVVEPDGQFNKEFHSENGLIKQSMSSPIKVAETYKEILKRIWERKQNSMMRTFMDDDDDYDYYKPLVVMAKSEGNLKLYHAPEDIKGKLVVSNELVEYLKNDIKVAKMMDKSNLLSQKQMKEISDEFLLMSVPNNRDYRKHYRDAFGLV